METHKSHLLYVVHVSFKKKIAKEKKEKQPAYIFFFDFGHLGDATAAFVGRWSGICFMIYDLQFNACSLLAEAGGLLLC